MRGTRQIQAGATAGVVSSACAAQALKSATGIPADSGRSIRVVVLIIAIIALSLGDLFMTMTYLRSGGMGEGNPVARLVIEYNSPALLVAWKCASVLLACLIFAVYRRKPFTEAACWCCVLILAWLTVQWWNYSSEAAELAQHIPVIATASERTDWVQLTQ